MPIRGEKWGLVNKFEKPLVGEREFNIRETTKISSLGTSIDNVFKPNSNTNPELYALILRKENDVKTSNNSTNPQLSSFKCYVFSGPHSEIPFNLEQLGNPTGNPTLEHYYIDMFPTFTAKNKDISNKISNSQVGSIVKISYENLDNFSNPIIVDVTSYKPLIPEINSNTIQKFKTNASMGVFQNSQFYGTSPDPNNPLRKESLRLNNDQPLKIHFPLPGKSVNVDYGQTSFPSSRQRTRFHRGIDISAMFGDKIESAENGVVIFNRFSGNYGNLVILRHSKNSKVFYTVYAHLQNSYVSIGQKIQKFENIGEVGSTGNSVGPHLHFELRFKNNNRGSSVDPLPHFEDIPTNIYSSFSGTIIRR